MPATSALAATQYWDLNSNGTWNTTTSEFSATAAGGSDTTFTAGNDVVFSSSNVTTSGVLSIATTSLTVDSITFAGYYPTGYTFSNGGTISIIPAATGAPLITLNPGAGAVTFNGPIIFGQNTNANVSYNIANNSSSLLTFNGLISNDNNTGTATGSGETLNVSGTGAGGVTFNSITNTNTATTTRPTALTINTTGAGATAVTLLTAASTYNGGTTVTSGILRLNGPSANLGNATNSTTSIGLNVGAAGVLDLNGVSPVAVENFSGSAGGLVVNDNNTNATLTIGGGNGTGGTYAGILEDNNNGGSTTGTLALTKIGTGTITLTGSNTNSGPTSITTGAGGAGGGGLTLSGNGSLANTSSITVGAYAQGNTTLSYNNSATQVSNRIGSAPVTLNGGSFSFTPFASGNQVVTAGPMSFGPNQTSALSFTAAGSGTSVFIIPSITPGAHSTVSAFLASANSATGRIDVVTAPTLINGILPWMVETSNANFGTISNSGTYNYLGAYANIAGVDVSTFDNNPVSNVKITGTQAALAGPTVENSLVDTYAGAQSLGGQALTLTSGGLILNNASAALGGMANDGSITTGTASQDLYVYSNANGVINSSITDNGNGSVYLDKDGGSTLTLAGVNTYTGATYIGQGSLTVTAGGSIAASSGITVEPNTTLTNSGTVSAITDYGTVTNNGVASSLNITSIGTATINGGSTTGPITANGALSVGGAGALTAGVITGTNGSAITYTNTYSGGNTLSFAAGTNTFGTVADNTAAGTLFLSPLAASTTNISTLTGASGSIVNFNGNANSTVNITNTLASGGAQVTVTSGTVVLNSGRNTADNIEVDGGDLVVSNAADRLSMNSNNQTLKITGGELNVITGNYGLRLNGDNGSGQGGGSNTTFNGTQTGGLLLISHGSGVNTDTSFNLGNSTASANVTNYTLSGGVLDSLGTGTVGNGNGYLDIGADTAGNAKATFTLSGTGVLLVSAAIEGDQGTGAKQAFLFNGGTLTATTFTATGLTSGTGVAVAANTNTLNNNGGTLAPGFISPVTGAGLTAGVQYTGKTTITGNYAVNSGAAALAINIGGTTIAPGFGSAASDYDNVAVTGSTTLGGRLNIGLINGYTPPTNSSTLYNILVGSSAGVTGSFNNLATATSGNSRFVLPNGLSSMLVATNNTGSVATVGGLTSVPAYTVSVGGYQATNTYTAAPGGNWDAPNAASWTNFDPGSDSSPNTIASGAVAQFGDGGATGTGANTATLSSTRNVQGILFSSATSGHNYTLAASGTGNIIIDNTLNNAAGTITDSSANGNSNAINVPITLNSNLNVTVTNAASTDTIGAPIGDNGTGRTLTLNGAGTLVLSASNTYSGLTTINSGALNVNGYIPGQVMVTSAGTLGGTGTIGGLVTLGSGASAINLQDGSANALYLSNGLTLNGGNQLKFDLGASSDSIDLLGGNYNFSGGNDTIYLANIGNIGTSGTTYTLISGANGINASNFTLGTPVLAGYAFTLAVSGNNLELLATLAGLPAAYWNGSIDSNWNTGGNGSPSNWSTSQGGGTNANAIPTSFTDVYFTANGATNFATTNLGQNFSVDSLNVLPNVGSLTITGTGSNGVPATNVLTVGASGINVAAGNSVLLSSSMRVALGASQTWTNNSASPFTVASNVTDSGSGFTITTSGTGITTLSGSNSYAGNVLSSGELSIGSDTASNPNLGGLTNPITFNGGALQVTGTSVQNFGAHAVTFVGGQTVGLDISNPANVFTVSQVLNQGIGGLNLIGPGTVALTASNTYTGATTINAGTLALNGGSINGSNVNVNGGALTENATGSISGSGATFTVTSGSAVLAGANTYTGATTISSGTLQLGNGGTTGTISTNSAIADNGNFIINRSNAVTEGTDFSSTIGGSGSVTYAGGNTLTLSGANSFAGGLILDGGTVSALTSTSALGGNGNGSVILASGASATLLGDGRAYANPIVFAGGGTLTVGQTAGTNNAPTFSGGATGAGNLLFADTGTGAMTIGTALLNNAGSIVNQGTGTGGVTISSALGSNVTSLTQNSTTSNLTLTGTSNNFAGPVNITQGEILISSTNDTLGTGTLTLGSAGSGANATLFYGVSGGLGSFAYTNPINVSGTGVNTIQDGQGAINMSGNVTLNNNTLSLLNTNNAGTNLSLTGTLGGTGNVTLSGPNGGGNFVFGTVNYTGNMTVGITNGNNISINGGAINNIGSVINNGTGTGTVTFNNTTFGNNVTVIEDSPTSALTINNDNTSFPGSSYLIEAGTLNSTLSNGGTQLGGATIYLGNSSVNLAATLNTGGGNSGTGNPIIVSGTGVNTIDSGGSGSQTITSPITINAGSNLTIDPLTNNTYTLTGNISGGATGAGNSVALTLKNAQYASKALTLSGSMNFIGTITNVTGNAVAADTIISGPLGSGITNVTQNSVTGLLLSGDNNNFAGSVTVTSGSLIMGNVNALNASNAVTVATSGTFDLGGFNETIGSLAGTGVATDSGAAKTLTIGGNSTSTFGGAINGPNTSFAVAGSATQILTGSSNYAGSTTIGSGATLQLGNGTAGNDGTILGTSGITDNGTLAYNRYGNTSTGVVISGAGAVTVSGPGSQTLTGASVYTGSTTINPGATLQLGNGTAGNDGSIETSSSIINNGTLIYNYASAETTSQALAGSGNVTVNGSGSQTFASTTTYTGTTTVNGTLIVSGGISGSKAVNVNSGGTLEVNGSITSGATTAINGNGILQGQGSVGPIVANGGTVAPGNGASFGDTYFAGPLTANGNVTLSGSTTFALRLGVDSNDSDNLSINGGLLSLNNTPIQLTLGANFVPGDYGYFYNIIIGGAAGSVGTGNDLFSYNGTALANGSTFNVGGNNFEVIYQTDASNDGFGTGNDINLELVPAAVPEPSTWAMFLGGTSLLVAWQRRRRHAVYRTE